MIGDLFDSPWKILIVAVVIIVLFGSKKLPSAARSLGQSMRILKREVQGLHEDEPESGRWGAQEMKQQLILLARQARTRFGGGAFISLLELADDMRAFATEGVELLAFLVKPVTPHQSFHPHDAA